METDLGRLPVSEICSPCHNLLQRYFAPSPLWTGSPFPSSYNHDIRSQCVLQDFLRSTAAAERHTVDNSLPPEREELRLLFNPGPEPEALGILYASVMVGAITLAEDEDGGAIALDDTRLRGHPTKVAFLEGEGESFPTLHRALPPYRESSLINDYHSHPHTPIID